MKTAQEIRHSYNSSTSYELWQVYGKWSEKKEESFKQIKLEMYNNNGFGLRILTASRYFYTCAYQVENESGERSLVYHTPKKKIIVRYF